MSKKLKKELRVILTALVLFLVILILDKAGVCPPVFENRWFSLLCYLVPYLLCGWPVLRKAALGIWHRQLLDESFLMTIASIGAFVTGESEEAAAVMLFYQIGEWFQSYAVGRSRKSISDLMDIAPESANRENEDGTVEEIDPDEVEIGDVLVIRPGEKIPVDGVVLSGESLVNTAALTGEPVPRSVREGSEIISGCVNGDGLLRIRAEKPYEDSTVAKILELVETASEKKSRTENFITRFARIYTPCVVGLAVLLLVVPSIVTGQWLTWLYRACTFLVISCPCALVISVPLAFFGGIGAASKGGVLVKGSNYLELLAGTETVVSDKTGTLTEGNFRVSAVCPEDGISEEHLLRTAALAEGLSTHPIACSIREELLRAFPGTEVNTNLVTDTDNISGKGLSAVVAGKQVLVGNEKLMAHAGISVAEAEDRAATVSYVAEDGKLLGMILIRDTVKKEAKEAVSLLKKCGVREFVMLTGDRKVVGEAVAKELGIDRVYAGLLPQEKVEIVEQLLGRSGRRGALAFIGDGINDAPTLTRADVGIAMGSMGSDAAIEAADVVIMDDRLQRIPAVIRTARKTVSISRQNIVFALAVKFLILALGAFGIANMWAAVFADVGVAFLCILNSMRLLTEKRTI